MNTINPKTIKIPDGCISYKCPKCDGKVDKNGDTIEDGNCPECPNHNGRGCDCETCGFTSCDQSC